MLANVEMNENAANLYDMGGGCGIWREIHRLKRPVPLLPYLFRFAMSNFEVFKPKNWITRR
jgi:hypothetical protein